MPEDLATFSPAVSGNQANLLTKMAGSTVKTGMDIRLEQRYGGQADAGSYSGHMGSIMDNGGAFLQDRVNSTNYVGRRGGGGGGGANPTARNFGPSNPGGYNWNTVDRGVNFLNKKLKNVNNAMTQSRNDYNSNLISNKITEMGQQVKNAKEQVDLYNYRNKPAFGVNAKAHAQAQKTFNQPVSPKTGKPSKAKNAQQMQGPVPPQGPLRPITPWAHA